MKKVVLGVGALALMGLSLPLMNLMSAPSAETQALLATMPDARYRAAAQVFSTKCVDCHSSAVRLPFYANLPIASTLIKKDMADGAVRFDFSDKLTSPTAYSDMDLARIEGVLMARTMPPARYVAMHWNAALSPADEDALLSWIAAERTRRRKDLGMAKEFLAEPIPPLPLTVDVDPERVTLGNKLFHDKRLSADNTLSCASCHAKAKGGGDRSKFSTGINGQVGPINAPTVFNAFYNHRQFWDGRAADLVEQAAGPVHNPIEMGSNWEQVLGKLKSDAAYVSAFKKLYSDGMTGDNIADAIAAFEMSLVTPNSRFDQYLRGDKAALSATEVKGYELFKANCASCHAGPAMGGLSFEVMGRRANYFKDRGTLVEVDNGRFNVTKEARDRHAFKVPTLRNVAVSYPYFHDGSRETLDEAVKAMGRYQVGRDFSETEVSQMVAFLKTLTGEYNGESLK